MKFTLKCILFFTTPIVFSQTPELFYQDGGELGPVEIRNEYLYYVDQNEGLKQLSISNPNEALVLVTIDEVSEDVAYIFWGLDESSVYFGDIFGWYRAPFSTTQTSEASSYLYFNSQSAFDVKLYNNEYYVSFYDLGTGLMKLTNIDPVAGVEDIGGSLAPVWNIATNGITFYYSDEVIQNDDNDDDENFGLYGATIGSFNQTKELLFNFNEPIHQLELQENFLYVLLQESNSIVVFDSNQPDPWVPINFITLDPSIYTIENIVIDQTDVYFTDSNQGAIFLLADAALSLEENASFTPLIFPNPVADYLFFQSERVHGLRILDTNGKILTSVIGGQITNQSSIDVRNLSKGVYIAYFTLEDGQHVVKRFIKK